MRAVGVFYPLARLAGFFFRDCKNDVGMRPAIPS